MKENGTLGRADVKITVWQILSHDALRHGYSLN